MTHTEVETAALIARFANEAGVNPDYIPGNLPTNPDYAPEVVLTAPESGYRVVIGGRVADVDASGYGAAVLAAMPVIGATLPNVAGYVFMWDVSVIDSFGVTADGKELAGMIQSARVIAQR